VSTHRHIDAVCVAVLIFTLLITVLFMNGEAYGIRRITDGDAEEDSGDGWFTANDRNGAWNTDAATRITLTGDSASFSGGGVYTYQGDVVISSAGKYVLSGILNDGSILVNTTNTSKVWILLDGVELNCSDGPCLDVEQADKVFLSLADGSENSMTTAGISEANRTEGKDGTLFARDDLTVNGTGSLTVSAPVTHGIVGNDELVIAGGRITVQAALDALHANDGLRIAEAELNLDAGDDAVALTGPDGTLYVQSGTLNATAGDKAVNSEGSILLEGGALTLTAANDGIHAAGSIGIEGGMLTVEAAEDGISADGAISVGNGTDLSVNAGDDGISSDSELGIAGGKTRLETGDNGITADGGIRITGGDLGIQAASDGITSAGRVEITNGTLTVEAGDDGIHSDTQAAVSGGTLLIPSCYEGIEALTIDVSGGEISIYPKDDGLNANGESGFGNFGGFGGGMPGGMPGGGPPNRDGETGGMNRPDFGGEMPEGMPFDGMPDFAEGERPEPPEGTAFGSGEMPATDGQDTAADEGERPKPPEGSNAAADNAAGGTGSASDSAEEETWIHISGGSITVVNDSARDADGLDSNGDIIISGGTVRVSMVNSGSNSALDFGSESGGVMEISGGNVVACGSYMMAEGFDSSSTQCAILYNISRGIGAGSTVSLEDSEGNVILSYEVPCSFSSVIMSCPEMKLGESYTVVIGDTAEKITLNEVSASYGNAQSEGFGGNMNWGGMQFRPKGMRQSGNRPENTESSAG